MNRKCPDAAGAWKVSDLASPDDYSFHLEPAQIEDIDDAVRVIREKGIGLDDVGRADFELSSLAGALTGILDEVRSHRGFLLLRGLPADRYTKDELGMICWGIGTHFGAGVAQNTLGDRLGHILDASKVEPGAFSYRNSQEITPHTDFADFAALMCLRRSKSGGESMITSALSVHDRILESRPEHMEVLYRGYHWNRRPDEKPGDLPYTPRRVPVFSFINDQLSCRYIRFRIEAGARAAGTPLTPLDTAALDYLEKVARDPELCLRFYLVPGDILFLNNYTTMHARTAFVDDDEPDRKRHLLRMWLMVPGFRQIAPDIVWTLQACRGPAGSAVARSAARGNDGADDDPDRQRALVMERSRAD